MLVSEDQKILYYCEGDSALPQIDHGGYGDIQKPSVHGSMKMALGVPA